MTFSTTEREDIALAEATKRDIWLKGVISDLGFSQQKAIIFCK